MPATMCILGASGDLTARLLLPGLGTLLARDPNRAVDVVGCDRADASNAWATKVQHAFATSGVADDSDAMQRARDARWFTADVTDPDSLKPVLDALRGADPLVLYFALPPRIAAQAVDALLHLDLPDGTQLAFEKPFGGDLAGARSLNHKLLGLTSEHNIHRIDHFLGQSTVLNLVSIRFANRLFEPVWNAENIAAIDIVYDESLTLEGRAGYYDHSGAMVDMLQSHLLQVMAFAMMQPPATLGHVDLRDATTAVLRACRPWGGDPVASSHRARYTAGTIDGCDVPNYVDEPGVDPANNTETLAQITVEVDTVRWQGVPVTLRSGKSLSDQRQQVVITFRPVRHLPGGLEGPEQVDRLAIELTPDRLELRITINTAENSFGLQQSVLAADLRQAILKPYGEVIAGVLDGDPALTVRGDAAEECWRIIDAYQRAWAAGDVPLQEYAAGSTGPDGWDAPAG